MSERYEWTWYPGGLLPQAFLEGGFPEESEASEMRRIKFIKMDG